MLTIVINVDSAVIGDLSCSEPHGNALGRDQVINNGCPLRTIRRQVSL